MSEIHLQRAIVDALNYSGCLVWRTNAGLIPFTRVTKARPEGKRAIIRVGIAGTSDIIGIRKKDGKMIAIEVKMPARRSVVSDLQHQFLENIYAAGGITGVATSVEEALEVVKQ